MKAVEIDFVSNEKKLALGADRNKRTNLSILKAGNDWGFVLSDGLDR